MTKLKVRGLKWKRLKVRGSVLYFCLYFILTYNEVTPKLVVRRRTSIIMKDYERLHCLSPFYYSHVDTKHIFT